jgi:hypothetical protein
MSDAPRPAPPADDARARRKDEVRRARAQHRLAQAVLGKDAVGSFHDDFDLGPDELAASAATARRARAFSVFGDLLAQGHPVRVAHVATVRALCDAGLRPAARAFALGTAGLPDGDALARMGAGLVLHSMAELELAWGELVGVDEALLAELLPVEAVTCALVEGSDGALAVARALGRHAASYDVGTLTELAGRYLARGWRDLARELVDEADARPAGERTGRAGEMLALLRRWTHPAPVGEPPAGAVSLAVMDYHQPDFDRASRNVGDYVQTLAMLGNLARFRATTFTGDDGLGELLGELQGRVRPDLHLPGGDARVHLTPVSRDFSSGDPVPPGTWMIAFGWHMMSTFRLGFDLPYHPHVHPIFLSFHLNRIQVLDDDAAVAYLREHGPVGCRDWATVDVLLSAGIDAFFTGCLTTTVSAVFPEPADVEHDEPRVVGAVDLTPGGLRRITGERLELGHGGAEFREASLVTGVRAALALLETYQRRFSRVVTSRLHSYLPATSLGIPARFRPGFDGDVRFDGLLGMTPHKPEFVAMRDDLRALLAEVHELVLAGTPRDEVYARWRELTRDGVERARARQAAPMAQPPEAGRPDPELARTPDRLRAGARRLGPHDGLDASRVTDVAFAVDTELAAYLPVVVESMLSHAGGPLRLWVTTRGVGAGEQDRLGRLFPDLPVTFLDCDDVAGDPALDRLLLAEVLADVDRLVVLDVDSVVEDDVTALAGTDLGGHPLAGRPGRHTGASLWRTAGDRLPAADASELRRTMSARHAFDFAAVDPGVLVLDLDRLRRDRFVAELVPLAGRFGLDDRELLTAYAGADYLPLDRRWHALPALERVEDPALVHYAGLGRPWDDELVPEGHRWQRHADVVAAREEGIRG